MYALITADLRVDSVIVADAAFIAGAPQAWKDQWAYLVEVSGDVNPGWVYDPGTGTFSPPPLTLAEAKSQKLDTIDQTTNYLLKGGFEYLGDRYSLGPSSREHLMQIAVFGSALSYPFDYPNIDETGAIVLNSYAEAQAFVGAGVARAGYILTGDSALSKAVADATTVAEVEAVVDNRS
jgi:hypothetical protein